MVGSGSPGREERAGARAERDSASFVSLLLFGMSVARRGVLVVISTAIVAATVLGFAVLAVVLARGGRDAPIHDVPLLASSALAYGGGVLVAFSAAAHALRRDRGDGVRALLLARTMSLRGYLVARVGGLALLVGLLVGVGTLAASSVALLVAGMAGVVAKTAQTALASTLFAVAFSAVVSPIAFAALGARSRAGGYMFLLGVLVMPELLGGLLRGVVPDGLREVMAVPSALDALRAAFLPGTVDPLRALRSVVTLAAYAGFTWWLVGREVRLVDESPEPP